MSDNQSAFLSTCLIFAGGLASGTVPGFIVGTVVTCILLSVFAKMERTAKSTDANDDSEAGG